MTELERCELAKQKGFTYNPETGELRGVHGKLITSKSTKGYIRFAVCVDKKRYDLFGHRLAWYLHYGKLPANHLDHIDGSPSNNKIENLRDVTNQQNQFNRTTAKGYRWRKQREKFEAQIQLNGKMIFLGLLNTEQDARAAYLEAKAKYHVIN